MQNLKGFPGVPVVESPFFSRHLKDIETSFHEIAWSLYTDGYAIIDFPDGKFFDKANQIIESLKDEFDFDQWRRDDWTAGKGLRLMDQWRTNKQVKEIATNETIIEMLFQIYGRQPYPFQTLNFPVGTQQHMHADTMHFNSIPERWMCGVWVALEDIGKDQGPLMYVPKTHKWPVLWGEHLGLDLSSIESPGQHIFDGHWENLVREGELEERQFTCKKGQALIWTANLLHGGMPQIDPLKTRWSQVTHYFFEGCNHWRTFQSNLSTGNIKSFQPPNLLKGTDYTISSEAVAALPENFDPEIYLSLHEDLRKLGMTPAHAAEHFIQYGMKEGRKFK